LGYFSLFEAALNLLPIPPLDGAKAWYVFARLFKPADRKKVRRPGAWRSYR
jgi:membrane-associated protease RseP (regulator of RpoE activity)